MGHDTSKDNQNANMHAMFLREKPLLEKIKQMRCDYDAMYVRLQEVLKENQFLR